MMNPTPGHARTMMVGHTAARGRFELARFPDGRWTIRGNGPTLGIWSPDDQAECLRVFATLIGLDKSPDGRPSVVVVRRRHLNPADDAPLN